MWVLAWGEGEGEGEGWNGGVARRRGDALLGEETAWRWQGEGGHGRRQGGLWRWHLGDEGHRELGAEHGGARKG